ncbi:hypothetical protein G4Y79_02635 [Phototrophicus methaneseepsis]|uniref:Uncharacterized protein n=1 Tax=Phototrophicus methaneseepsis TaxID=2710758 RepID=A0A7S8IF74_9CHLR|nr:hypothetical protein [Phototrophicus methaneseepsis]QPC83292.1 hypothetical protein G4Y79_02635 [Phototrophicus methaneseepsis]
MARRLKRIFALFAIVGLLLAGGLGGAHLLTGDALWGSNVFAIFPIAFLIASIMNWVGFRLLIPSRFHNMMNGRFAEILAHLAISTVFMIVPFLVLILGYMFIGLWPTISTMPIVFVLISVLILGFFFDQLGFRVSFQQDEEDTHAKKPKRISRIDDLFASLSDAEIRELRQRLVDNSLHEDEVIREEFISEDERYAEKSKRRLQAER